MDISQWPTVAPAISTVAAAFLTVTTAISKRGTGIYDLAPVGNIRHNLGIAAAQTRLWTHLASRDMVDTRCNPPRVD